MPKYLIETNFMPIKRVPNVSTAPQFLKSKPSVQSVVIRDDIVCGLPGCSLCTKDVSGQRPHCAILIPTPSVLLSYTALFGHTIMRRLFTVVILDSVIDYVKEQYPTSYRALQRSIQSDECIRFPDKSCKDTSNGHALCRTAEQLRDALLTSQRYFLNHSLHVVPDVKITTPLTNTNTSCPVIVLCNKESESKQEIDFPILSDTAALKGHLDNMLFKDNKPWNPVAIDISIFFSNEFYCQFISPLSSRIEATLGTPCPSYEEFHELYSDSTLQLTLNPSFTYLPHIPIEKAESMISKKQLLTGKVTAWNRGRRGEVLTSYKHMRVVLCNPFYLNRSLAGDRVALALIEQEAWENIEQSTQIDAQYICYEACDYVDKLATTAPGEVIYGIVVAIMDRQRYEYCGTVKIPFALKHLGLVPNQSEFDLTTHTEKTAMLRPFRHNLPDFFIKSLSSINHYIGKRVLFIIESWGCEERSPTARVSSILGDVGDRDVEADVVLFEYDIPHANLQENENIMLELKPFGFSSGHYSIPSGIYASAVTPPTQQESLGSAPEAILSQNILSCKDHPTSRLNLTSEYTVSVDPPSCKDIDDALHVKTLSPTTFEVGVHIADVSFYVRPESAIDLEARKRGTSVYFPDRRIDMLPSILTEDICSLRSGVDRLSMSALIELELYRDEGGIEDPGLDMELAKVAGLSSEEQKLRLVVKQYSFTQAIIRSRASLAYHEAQWLCEMDAASVFESYEGSGYRYMSKALRDHINEEILTNQIKVAKIQQSLKILLFLSKLLKMERLRNGALILETPAVEFTLDPVTKLPTNLHEHVSLPTMSMIEEFMLLANRLAAEYTLEKYPSISVLRRHPKPTEEQFITLKKQIKSIFHFDLNTETNKALSASIHTAIKENALNPKQVSIVRQMLTRCMMLAKYFVSSEYTIDEFYHYGLTLPIYTHFTSPIRRYSDILVHRLLAAADERDNLPATHSNTEVMSQICANLNLRKESADRASNEADKIFSVLYVIQMWSGAIKVSTVNGKDAKGDRYSWLRGRAGVLRIGDRRISVILRNYGIDAEIRLRQNEVVAVDPNNMWVDVAIGTEQIVRRVTVFDEVWVEIGLDFSRIYEFDLNVRLISDDSVVDDAGSKAAN